jgi:hypothetical protein
MKNIGFTFDLLIFLDPRGVSRDAKENESHITILHPLE